MSPNYTKGGESDPQKQALDSIQEQLKEQDAQIKALRKGKKIWPTIAISVIAAAGVTAGGTVPEIIRAREASHVAYVAQQQAEMDRDLARYEAKQKVTASLDFQQQFLGSYRDHLASLGVATRAYQETPTPEQEQRLRFEIESFVTFIQHWRHFNALMATVLNGNVTRLQNASKVWNPGEISVAQDLLLRSLGDTEPLIRAALSSLPEPAKPQT